MLDLEELFAEAVKQSVLKHWTAGRSVYEIRDGWLIELRPIKKVEPKE